MNKVIIASAGAGKSTFIVSEALQAAASGKRILITTFTEACRDEINAKIIKKNGCVPSNLYVITWFSFLIKHWIRPYQGCLFDHDIKGMILCNSKSGEKPFKVREIITVYWGEKDFRQYYFSPDFKVYSDKMAKLSLRCEEASDGNIIKRLRSCFDEIYVDEVQDLAGYDLEILQKLFESPIKITLVGDPRQATYSTVNTEKNAKYKKAAIVNFFADKTPDVSLDDKMLNENFRCFHEINDFANKLYPKFAPSISNVRDVSGHDGVYLLPEKLLSHYLEIYTPVQLRWDKKRAVDERYPIFTFGTAKGLTFERVLIYPTAPMLKWFQDENAELTNDTRAKLYVGLTRPIQSIAIVYNGSKKFNTNGLKIYATGE
ncbi:UvrD-helicase domain-containing protein [Budviciaceae bacterium BWR-B9]|uniref:DNA 3'-5' helicase II n=1 Tax=Limnobaculum allomyrinae TaxID=2791986 RepID=A0ABS1IN19_9GAMM|nr:MULTISPECIES: UvrD-helicase domain-containing protein [Limnobaculum]MBK5143148.1 UvrD-helicase domain-containing protein [Limnobaculum allomyrinae]MBV7691036.1 UvrD-helicase domain-containing protein [Limnobaculum sp. M2-1]